MRPLVGNGLNLEGESLSYVLKSSQAGTTVCTGTTVLLGTTVLGTTVFRNCCNQKLTFLLLYPDLVLKSKWFEKFSTVVELFEIPLNDL